MNFLRKILIPFRLWRRGISLPCQTRVFGSSNLNAQGALAQSREGDLLQVVHTPTERHAYNVYVYSIELNRVLGYLDKDLAKSLVSIFGNGFCLDAQIDEIIGSDAKTDPFVADIVIFKTTTFMEPYLQELPYYHDDTLIKYN